MKYSYWYDFTNPCIKQIKLWRVCSPWLLAVNNVTKIKDSLFIKKWSLLWLKLSTQLSPNYSKYRSKLVLFWFGQCFLGKRLKSNIFCRSSASCTLDLIEWWHVIISKHITTSYWVQCTWHWIQVEPIYAHTMCKNVILSYFGFYCLHSKSNLGLDGFKKN